MRIKIMQKLVFMFILMVVTVGNSKIYGISDNFKFVIETIGIPRYNVYGKEINEEIYNAYNVFSYGWPEELGTDVGQRWKNSVYGLWAQGIGKYKGVGIRGEYNLLGRDYSGNIINNYYFPVDTLPVNTPEYWEYYSNPGAAESWNDSNKYKCIEQLEYMKNTKLLFNDVSSRENSDNPEKIKEYNITALNIGLDKARLDVCSTWKTNGIIHARRIVDGRIRYAVFLTNPMAANARVQSSIDNLENNCILRSNEDEIEINIGYSANVVNMTGYAKKEHIKEINSKLYINGNLVKEISGSKTDTLGSKYMLKLTRDELVENAYNKIEIVNESYAHTEFAVDGLMQNSTKQIVNIFVEEKEKIPLKMQSVRILEKENDVLVVRPLAQNDITISGESIGITEAGKHICIKLEVDDNIKYENISNLEVFINEIQINDIQVEKVRDGNVICVIFKIPTDTVSSIYGWKSLRNVTNNYFSIDKTEIGKRIQKAHSINIKTKHNDKEYETIVKIDTIDDYIANINYKYGSNSLNNETLTFEEWLN